MVSRKITSVDDLSLKEISSIVNKALNFRKSLKQKKTNKPKNIFNLFLEASTRTTISFELAAKKLGVPAMKVTIKEVNEITKQVHSAYEFSPKRRRTDKM